MKSLLCRFIFAVSIVSTMQAQATIDLPIDGPSSAPVSSAPAPAPVSRRGDDCLILKGALAVTGALNVSFSYSGGFGVWKNLAQYNIELSNAIANDLQDRVAPLLKNSSNRQEVQTIAQELSAGEVSGWGHFDPNYWSDTYREQAQKMQSAASSLHSLTQSACQ